jgi:hypothetical protein
MSVTQSYSSDGPVSASTGTITLIPCTSCDGKGERTVRIPNPFDVCQDSFQKKKCEDCGGTGKVEVPNEAQSSPSQPAPPMRTPAENEIYGYIHSSNAQYFMACLLGTVLSQIDASVPNKDQNKAMKHLVRKAFDSAVMDVHRMAWPPSSDPQKDKQSAAMTGAGMQTNGYILQPEQ